MTDASALTIAREALAALLSDAERMFAAMAHDGGHSRPEDVVPLSIRNAREALAALSAAPGGSKGARDAHRFGFWALCGPTNDAEQAECEQAEEASWQDYTAQLASAPPTAPGESEVERAHADGMDEGATFVLETLAKDLGVDRYEQCDGTDDWRGDVAGTVWNILCTGKIFDPETNERCPHPPTAPGESEGAYLTAFGEYTPIQVRSRTVPNVPPAAPAGGSSWAQGYFNKAAAALARLQAERDAAQAECDQAIGRLEDVLAEAARLRAECERKDAALAAQAEADRLDDEFCELCDRAGAEGWYDDPTGGSHINDAQNRAALAKRKAREAVVAALPAERGETRAEGWRDIESAPTDGRKFDAWCVCPTTGGGGCRLPDVQMRGNGSGFGWTWFDAEGRSHWQYLDNRNRSKIWPVWCLALWRDRPAPPPAEEPRNG